MYKFIPFIILFTLLQSCYTYKTNSQSVTSPDYNNRQIITNPYFIKRKNAFGVSVMGLSIIGAGYAGYQNGPIEIQKGNETLKNVPANIAFGLITGWGINMLFDKAFGLNNNKKIISNEDFSKWTKKANKNFIDINKGKVIPKKQDENFTVNTIDDVKDFKAVFGNSTFEDKMFTSATSNLNRNELVDLINIYPTQKNVNLAKEKYVLGSGSVFEMYSSNNTYDKVVANIEDKCFQIINTGIDAQNFNKYFSNSKKTDDAFEKGLEKIEIPNYPEYFESFVNVDSVLIKKTKVKYISSFSSVENMYNANLKYNNIVKDIEEMCFTIINTKEDALNYNKYFSNSKRINEVYSKGIEETNIIDYPEYINSFKKVDTTLTSKHKEIYITDCKSVIDCYNRQVKYPEYIEFAAQKATDFLNEYKDYENFYSYFEDTSFITDVKLNYLEIVNNEFQSINTNKESDYRFFCNKYASTKYESVNNIYLLAKLKYEELNKIKLEKIANWKIENPEEDYDDEFEDIESNPVYDSVVNMDIGENKTYTGSTVNNKPNGQGKWTNTDGEWYEGEFKNGRANGKGTLRLKDGIRYYGTFKKGKPNGIFTAKSWTLLGLVSNEWYAEYKNGVLISSKKTKDDFDRFLNGTYGGSTSSESSNSNCLGCVVDNLKTKFPSEGQNAIYTYDKPGKIYMKNGSEYDYYYSNDKESWLVTTQMFQFNKKFDMFNDMLNYFLDECRDKNCN